MEKRKRLLDIEAIINVKSYRLSDLSDGGDLIYKHVPKEEMCKLLNIYYYKRNLKRMAFTISKRLIRFFFEKLVSHLMESRRVLLPYGRTMYIGVLPPREDAEVNKRFLNLHTYGKVYGIKLTGIGDYRYHFKMNPARRKELYERLYKGQEFYE